MLYLITGHFITDGRILTKETKYIVNKIINSTNSKLFEETY